jgi:ABC-type transport system involved in multi-copper enzyme maturation permease subunit
MSMDVNLPLHAPPRRFPPLAGFWTSFVWGLRLTSSWKRLLLVSLVACGLAFLLGHFDIGQKHRGRPIDAYFDLWDVFDTSILKFLLPIISLVIVSRGFSAEVGERTLVYHLVRPISRSTLCLSRFFSGVVPAAFVSLLTLVTLSHTTGLDLPARYWLSLPITAVVSTLAVGAVYYAFSTLLRRGMIAALIYTFVFEPLFSGQSGAMQKLSIMFHVRGVHHGLTDALFAERSENVRLALEPPALFNIDFLANWANPAAMESIRDRIAYDTPLTAAITVACITIALTAFTCWRVSKKDFPLKD